MGKILKKISLWFIRRKEFKRYKNILANGVYVADSRMKCFCLMEARSLKFVETHLKIRIGARKRFSKFKIKTKGLKLHENSIILLSNSTMDNGRPQSVKVFNLTNCQVSTYYNDEIKLKKDIQGGKMSTLFFPTPKRILEDIDKRIIIDEIIFSKSVDLLQNDERIEVYKKVIKDYISYYERVGHALVGKFSFSEREEDIQSLHDAVTLIRDFQFVTVVQHGDLTFNNILYEQKQNKLFYIDFEHSQAILFYYDMFFLMQNDYIYNRNSILLEEYLKGTFDELFAQLFQCVGLVFDYVLKKEYFVLFLIEMYQLRIKSLSSNNKRIALNHIKKLFDYIFQENF